MDYKFRKFQLSQFFILSRGSLFSFLINVISLYLFSVLYSREDFGNYALFVSSVTLFSVLVTFRLENLLVLQKSIKEVVIIGITCKKVIEYFSILISIFSLFLFSFSISFFEGLPILWLFVPFATFSLAHILVFLNWNNKIKAYKLITNYRIIQALCVGVFGIIFGIYKLSIGLILAYSLGLVVSFLYLNMDFKSKTAAYTDLIVKNNDVKEIIRTNLNFIKNSFGVEFLVTITRHMPNFILNAYFGNGIVGVYDMSLKILNIPKNLISTNIGELYYQKASVFYHRSNQKFRKITLNTCLILFFIAILFYLPFLLFGEEIFSLFLGQKWIESGELSEIIACWYVLLFITSPMAYVFYIKRVLHRLFRFMLFSFFVKVVFLFCLVNFKTQMQVIYLYSYGCIFLELLLLYTITKTSFSEANITRP